MSQIVDEQFPEGDWRRNIAKVHQHITDTGEAGYSGRYDPKTITDLVASIKYMEMGKGPAHSCELCKGGDMISPWRRHLFSPYRPGEHWHHRIWRSLRIAWGRFRGIMGV